MQGRSGQDREDEDVRFSTSFKMGAVALVFLIIGFQVALFVRRAAVDVVTAHRDRPDTVFVVSGEQAAQIRREASHSPRAQELSAKASYSSPAGGRGVHGGSRGASAAVPAPASPLRSKKVESFSFNPNTVSVEDLVRLGFSPRQAESIDKYRRSGGRFRRPSDFAKSYVVADSVFARLEPYIDIPLLDINAADSADFDALPGIGPYFAARMVRMRGELRGYSYAEQLMDIYNFGEDRFNALKDLIKVGPPEPYPIWTLPEDSLALHPYIGRYGAHGVVLYRQNTLPAERNVLDLTTVLRPGMAEKLARCRLQQGGALQGDP